MSPLAALAPDPLPAPLPAAIAERLVARGGDPAPRPGESAEDRLARIETSLMALYRDERDPAAFEALYARALPTVRRCLGAVLRGLPPGPDLSELVQDVFVNVYRYAKGFRDEHERSFRSWVSTIATNVVRRHGARRPALQLGALTDPMQEPADRRSGPLDLALSGESSRELSRAWMLLLLHYAAAWRELAPRDRLALELVEVQGVSYSEACARLRVRMSNMKMIMFRARKRIRARIALAMGEAPVLEQRLAG